MVYPCPYSFKISMLRDWWYVKRATAMESLQRPSVDNLMQSKYFKYKICQTPEKTHN